MAREREIDLIATERREGHLWIATLALLLVLASVTIVTFSVLIDKEDALSGTELTVALGGLFLLTVLFCLYAIQAHRSFQRIRSFYQAKALRDPLTGLLNRQSFADRFETEVARAQRDEKVFPILLCDLDHFKQLNDTHGHQYGDNILREVGAAFLSATRGADSVFRWGGDEFLVILSVATRDGALVAARRIRDSVREIGHRRGVRIDLSIGVAFYPEHGDSQSRLISLADRALYIAKKGGHRIHVGEEEYSLDDDAVALVFQPVVELGSRKVIGYEALSRDPAGKLGIQQIFRRYAAVGQLAELKKLIFVSQVEKASKLGLERVFINIDFSSLQSTDPFPVPEGMEVILEISETESLADVRQNLHTADAWRRQGFKFAIDDFGSGFMSLPFISRLVPEYIKIDSAMVSEAAQSQQFGGFLKDMVRAMRNYSKDGIIAEGIETESEIQVVEDLGIDQVQGYLTGRPKKWE